MISEKIKNLFLFIDFLHTNIDNFNQYNTVIDESFELDKKRNSLKPRENYKEKTERDKVQTQIEKKFKVIKTNIVEPIKNKATELNVCNFQKEPTYYFNAEEDIHKLKDNFNNEDIEEIVSYKNKYIEYRKSTHRDFITLAFFFNDLDRILKGLFDYFKDSEQNEFEEFEQKTIQVNSFEEMIKQFKKDDFTTPESKAIIDKFKNIGFLDYKKIIEELKEYKTISQKLDRLKEIKIKENFLDEYHKIEDSLTPKEHSLYSNIKKDVLKSVFGNNSRFTTPLYIPDPIYNKYFKNESNNPEFTYWFLKYNAEFYFKLIVTDDKRFQNKINSDIKETFIKAELKKIEDAENKAKELLLNKNLDIYKSDSQYHREINILRILDGNYYKENTYNAVGIPSREAEYYYIHKLLKPYLIKLLNEVNEKSNKSDTPKKEFEEYTWFKVGLKFATGEAHKLYDKYKSEKGHFKKITVKLGFKETDRPFFSETINNNTTSNNNIYSNLDKMQKIKTHCTENNIDTCNKFNDALNSLLQKQY